MITNLIEKFIQERISIYNFSKKYKISQEEIIKELKNNGYLYAKTKTKTSLIIDLKDASDEYLSNDQIQAQEICEKYGLCHCTFSKYMKEYLNKPIKARVKSKFNDNYFDSIDTEIKAYLLGFIYADGYISSTPIDDTKEKNIYTIEVSIQSRDIEILELMKSEFKTPRPILKCKGNHNNERVRLIVNSMHMWNVLNDYGCTPRKSFTEKFPNENIFKDKSLIRHFIRGYFDGDGCITYSDKTHKYPAFHMMGTYNFLLKVQEYFPEESRNLTIRHNHNNSEEEIRFIRTSHEKARKILKYLYDNSTVYLSRKYKRFRALCYYEITEEEDKIGELCDENTELTDLIAEEGESVV